MRDYFHPFILLLEKMKHSKTTILFAYLLWAWNDRTCVVVFDSILACMVTARVPWDKKSCDIRQNFRMPVLNKTLKETSSHNKIDQNG